MQEFVELSFERAGLKWQDYVVLDERFKRPAEVDSLLADPSKASRQLNWKPKVSFEELVYMMVDSELEKVGEKEKSLA